MNATTLTSVLGIVQAVGVSVVDFIVHTNMDGGAMKQPTFWIALVIAAAMGLKGYFTQGTAPVGHEVVTQPVAPASIPQP